MKFSELSLFSCGLDNNLERNLVLFGKSSESKIGGEMNLTGNFINV